MAWACDCHVPLFTVRTGSGTFCRFASKRLTRCSFKYTDYTPNNSFSCCALEKRTDAPRLFALPHLFASNSSAYVDGTVFSLWHLVLLSAPQSADSIGLALHRAAALGVTMPRGSICLTAFAVGGWAPHDPARRFLHLAAASSAAPPVPYIPFATAWLC